jgi:hypothetical protein
VRDERDVSDEARRWGLCAACAHHLVVTSDRGSRFVRCARARTDPRFPRYPRVPVVACAGYEPGPVGTRRDA